MATENRDKLAETASALLDAINEAGDKYGHPDQIKTLAEAYALIATNDVRAVDAGSGRAVTF